MENKNQLPAVIPTPKWFVCVYPMRIVNKKKGILRRILGAIFNTRRSS
jgi:hypothetical protein